MNYYENLCLTKCPFNKTNVHLHFNFIYISILIENNLIGILSLAIKNVLIVSAFQNLKSYTFQPSDFEVLFLIMLIIKL